MNRKRRGWIIVLVSLLGLSLAGGGLIFTRDAFASALLESLSPSSIVPASTLFQFSSRPMASSGKENSIPSQPEFPFVTNNLNVPISINEDGFSPSVLTVTIGSTLAWTNQSSQPVQLRSGSLYNKVFLPLLLKYSSGSNSQGYGITTTSQPTDLFVTEAFSDTIQPGETFTHTFETPGTYPYYLANNPQRTGMVTVVEYIEACGTISHDTIWEYATYLLTCSVNVPQGVTLTVTNGAVVKLGNGSLDIQVSGNLIATGSSSDPVIFTSYKDDTVGGDTNADGVASSPAVADWRTIYIYSDGQAHLEHALLRYGGAYWGSPYYTGMGNLYNGGGVVHMDHVTSTLGAFGLWTHGGSVDMRYCAMTNSTVGLILSGDITNTYVLSSTFAYNTFGIRFGATISPTITNNTIFSNTSYGVYNDVASAINAINNWWGNASGPYHASLNPTGTGDPVSDNVLFNPWLAAPP